MEKEEAFITTWQGWKLELFLWTSVWRFPKNLTAELPRDPDMSLLGVCRLYVSQSQRCLHSHIIAALVLCGCAWMDAHVHMCTCVHVYVVAREQFWMSSLRCLPPFASGSLTALGLD